MSIEKKSLISNRVASKKAILTKPEVTKVESAKLLGKGTRIVTRLAGTRLTGTRLTGTRLTGTRLTGTRIITS